MSSTEQERGTIAQWTPERGWHNVTEQERKEYQAQAVARLTTPAWVRRARSAALPVKEYR